MPGLRMFTGSYLRYSVDSAVSWAIPPPFLKKQMLSRDSRHRRDKEFFLSSREED